MSFEPALTQLPHLLIRQRKELGELIGFETRNKYEIIGSDGRSIGFAAEQQKGFLGFLVRQFLGHWRTFDLHFFNASRQLVMVAHHPFRFIFQTLEVSEATGRKLGAIRQKFSVLNKKFVVEDAQGQVIMEVASPLWRLWTFPFKKGDLEVAAIKKKWSGAFTELITDADQFLVEFSPNLRNDERLLLMAAGLFIDLQYFEYKAN